MEIHAGHPMLSFYAFYPNKLCMQHARQKCAIRPFNQSFYSLPPSVSLRLPGVALRRTEPGSSLDEARKDVGGDGLGRVADAQGDDLGRGVGLQERGASAADLGE